MKRKIESFNPHIVASSALATCNTYVVSRTLETVKKIDPNILTVTGGRHFTVTTQESLEEYSVIDVIVRGEGEQTLTELVKSRINKAGFSRIKGISFRNGGEIKRDPPDPLLKTWMLSRIPAIISSRISPISIISAQWQVETRLMLLSRAQGAARTAAPFALNGNIGKESGGLNPPSVLLTKWSSAIGTWEQVHLAG